jgi:hypothetical protein
MFLAKEYFCISLSNLMTNLVPKLDRIDAELRQQIKLEVDKGDGNKKLAVLMRARVGLQDCITNLLELPREGVK